MFKKLYSNITITKVLVVLGVIALAVSAVSWWRLVYSSPTKVFDRMLAGSLTTTSVTKAVSQLDSSQDLTQTTLIQTAPNQLIQSVSVLKQANDPNTVITTESIGSPQADFVRYTDIKTGKKPDGDAFDFSSVLGIWGKSDANDPSGAGAQLYNQNVLGVLPISNLPYNLRSSLLNQIKEDQVYKIDTSKVTKKLQNGRPVYTYDVQVMPVAYVSMLKTFAHDIGITQLEQVDPSRYKDSAPLKFIFEIDVWSGQLNKVTYDGAVRIENYQAYGAQTQIVLPTSSIDVNELQGRLQKVQ